MDGNSQYIARITLYPCKVMLLRPATADEKLKLY